MRRSGGSAQIKWKIKVAKMKRKAKPPVAIIVRKWNCKKCVRCVASRAAPIAHGTIELINSAFPFFFAAELLHDACALAHSKRCDLCAINWCRWPDDKTRARTVVFSWTRRVRGCAVRTVNPFSVNIFFATNSALTVRLVNSFRFFRLSHP